MSILDPVFPSQIQDSGGQKEVNPGSGYATLAKIHQIQDSLGQKTVNPFSGYATLAKISKIGNPSLGKTCLEFSM
jgi:hypothetical protein